MSQINKERLIVVGFVLALIVLPEMIETYL